MGCPASLWCQKQLYAATVLLKIQEMDVSTSIKYECCTSIEGILLSSGSHIGTQYVPAKCVPWFNLQPKVCHGQNKKRYILEKTKTFLPKID
jgi:hypothetical protein